MLNKEEEQKLANYLGNVVGHQKQGYEFSSVPTEAFLWLAERLKETNDELKDLKDKHNQLDIMLAQCLTEREQYKLELDQLKGKA